MPFVVLDNFYYCHRVGFVAKFRDKVTQRRPSEQQSKEFNSFELYKRTYLEIFQFEDQKMSTPQYPRNTYRRYPGMFLWFLFMSGNFLMHSCFSLRFWVLRRKAHGWYESSLSYRWILKIIHVSYRMIKLKLLVWYQHIHDRKSENSQEPDQLQMILPSCTLFSPCNPQ